MARKTPGRRPGLETAFFQNDAAENNRPTSPVNTEPCLCLCDDPLRRLEGEHIAAWIRRWHDAGLLAPWPAGLPVPLAIGIRDQLLERLDTAVCAPQRFARLLGHYCHQLAYLSTLARPGAMRHGLESAPGKRPGKRLTEPAWVRHMRDQCATAGVAFWLKQLAINGKVVELPELDGRAWAERPAHADARRSDAR